MEKSEQTKRIKWVRVGLVVGLAGMAVLLGAAFYAFGSNVERNEIERANKLMQDVAISNEQSIQHVVDTYFDTLKGIADGVRRYGAQNRKDATVFLNGIAHGQGYERLTVCFADGSSYSSDGQIKDISAYGVSERIQTGETFIQDVHTSAFDGQKVVNFFVPIPVNQSDTPASLMMEVSTLRFSEELNKVFFYGDLRYFLIDRSGNYVATNQVEEGTLQENFFDIARDIAAQSQLPVGQITNPVVNHTSGNVMFQYQEAQYLGNFLATDINDWVMLSVEPKQVVMLFADRTSAYAMTLLWRVVAVMLCVVLVFFLLLQKRKYKAEMDELCFRILAEQMNKVIFDWDFASGKITSTSNMVEIFGRDIFISGAGLSAKSREMIHPDDLERFKQVFEETRKCKNFTNLHFRIRDAQGNYRWSAISAIGVTDKKGKPYKAIAFLDDIDEQIRREEGLRQQAERDQLTGLFNKATTELLVRATLAEGNAQEDGHALFMIDIDNFKSVNDMMGHLYGDLVLSTLSEAIKPIFRKDDILGRIGGDEFLVLLKNFKDRALVHAKAGEICRLFDRSFSENGRTCGVAASVGIALFPRDGLDFETLYKNADIALYMTKDRGKNGYTIFDHAAGNMDNTPASTYRYERTEIEENRNIFHGKRYESSMEFVMQRMLEAQDPREVARSVLQWIVAHHGFSGCYVFVRSKEEDLFENKYEFIADGSSSKMQQFRRVQESAAPEVFEALRATGRFMILDLKELPKTQYVWMSGTGIRSLYLFGISIDGKLHSFIGFDDCRKVHPLSDSEVERLHRVCTVILKQCVR